MFLYKETSYGKMGDHKVDVTVNELTLSWEVQLCCKTCLSGISERITPSQGGQTNQLIWAMQKFHQKFPFPCKEQAAYNAVNFVHEQ